MFPHEKETNIVINTCFLLITAWKEGERNIRTVPKWNGTKREGAAGIAKSAKWGTCHNHGVIAVAVQPWQNFLLLCKKELVPLSELCKLCERKLSKSFKSNGLKTSQKQLPCSSRSD